MWGGDGLARQLEQFTNPFETSDIAFLLAELVTNGGGEMVDLTCRFLNGPAAATLGTSVDTLQGQRLSRVFPSLRPDTFAPLADVAFSGSSATFVYTTLLGRQLQVTCYQPMYGMVACILDETRRAVPSRDPTRALAEHLPGAVAVLELSRRGVRNLSFNRRLCQLSGYSRKEFLSLFSEDFCPLVLPEDWADLLQALLDAARDGHPVNHPFRLLRKSGSPLWMELRAEPLPGENGVCLFNAALLDVDSQTRGQAALMLAQTDLANIQTQRNQLWEALPGGVFTFCLTADGRFEPLRINRRLADLLGEPPDRLLAQLAADPLWCFLPADREELLAALSRARGSLSPLRRTVSVLRKNGEPLYLLLEIGGQRQEDGSILAAATVSDVTEETVAGKQVEFHAELCDLLLAHSNTVSLDYDPASTTAQIEFCDESGKRTSRTIPNYLEALKTLSAIHPEDRKVVAANLRRLSAKSGTRTFAYRGDYDGRGWRWRQASCTGMFDSKGDVCRVLGMAEDISAQRAAAERFRDLFARQADFAERALAAARLDLSANRLLDAKSSNRHLMQVLFGNSAAECLSGIQRNFPAAEEQLEFETRFRRETLLENFQRGASHFDLLHRFSMGDGTTLWCRTLLELAENPENRHIEAFLLTLDVDEATRRTHAMSALCRRAYSLAFTVQLQSEQCCFLCGADALPGTTYAALEGPALKTLCGGLEVGDCREINCTLRLKNGPQTVQLQVSWLDESRTHLLMAVGEY